MAAKVAFSWRKCAISGCLVGQTVRLKLLSLLSVLGFTVSIFLPMKEASICSRIDPLSVLDFEISITTAR